MFKKVRKSLLVALALAVGASAYLATRVGAYQFTPEGANTDANRHRQLLWVYNAEGSTALANGDVVVWYKGTVADGFEVKLCSSSNQKLVAGVSIGAVAATSWGFIEVHGYHAAIKVATATTAGDALSTSSTSGKSATNNSADFSQFASALETTTSSTTVKGFIRL